MKDEKDRHRRPAKVESISLRDEDHGIDTCWIMLSAAGSGGWGQGFGGLVLSDEKLNRVESYKGAICDLFGVNKIEAIVGRLCYALYAYDGDKIEGLEVDSRRFIQRAWVRHNFPKWKNLGTALEERERSIRDDIIFHRRRIREQEEALTELRDGYIDWEAQ